MKLWAVTMGIGAALGAVGILMMPRDNPTRKLADEAATKAEGLASKLTQKMEQKLGMDS